MTDKIKELDRLRRREFYKNQKSKKWLKLNENFLKLCDEEKRKYAENIVSDLKTSDPSKWYSKIKRMCGQNKSENVVNVAELDGIYDKLQSEIIADHYAQISNQFQPLQNQDFEKYLDISKISPVSVEPDKIKKIIRKMNHKAATLEGDLPIKILKEFSEELSSPLSHLISCCLAAGVYPDLWKVEYVTPVPKIYPPEKITDLRKISCLLNL